MRTLIFCLCSIYFLAIFSFVCSLLLDKISEAVLHRHSYQCHFSLYLFIYGCSGSSCLLGLFPLAVAPGATLWWQCLGFSLPWLSSLQSTGSMVVAHRLSCSTACGLFPDQGLNLRLPHSQADSLPTREVLFVFVFGYAGPSLLCVGFL